MITYWLFLSVITVKELKQVHTWSANDLPVKSWFLPQFFSSTKSFSLIIIAFGLLTPSYSEGKNHMANDNVRCQQSRGLIGLHTTLTLLRCLIALQNSHCWSRTCWVFVIVSVSCSFLMDFSFKGLIYMLLCLLLGFLNVSPSSLKSVFFSCLNCMLPVELLSKVMGKITVCMVSLIHLVVRYQCDWACLLYAVIPYFKISASLNIEITPCQN